ncbi:MULTISPECIES: DUF6344 domain-containing protein [unclassified Streptomyces]|uniref:DUF6344 domain-containing protein n=1 Tax=unclassified Streptomyces TaxID=2593676 RepID=UPI0038285FC1
MAAFKVKKLWTVFLTAFFAVLASLGLTTPATVTVAGAAQPTDRAADRPAPAPAAAHRAAVALPAARATLPRALPRARSLPPTIKQRIRAEAHGSSPSVRHLPALTTTLPGDDDDGAHAADAALVAA